MALFIRQDEGRSKLQERLAAELQEKAKARALEQERPDGVDDSQFIKNTKQTTSLGWVWAVIGIAVIAIAVTLIFALSQS